MDAHAASGVAAVVVTYNRLEKLRRCVRSVLDQTSSPAMAIVVDNASTDGTKDWLIRSAHEDPRIRPVHLDENTGGAGGFHTGIKLALREGVEYVWVMDDDCYPRPSALSLLMEAFCSHRSDLGDFPAFACSRVLCGDERSPCHMNTPTLLPQWDLPYSQHTPALAAQSCSFVSCLFRADDVRRLGLPLKEYFIWLDDVEFTFRLARDRYGLVVLDSLAIHDLPTNERVNWSQVTPENAWKYRYGARNEASWRLRNQGVRSYIWLVRSIRRQLSDGSVSWQCRFGIFWYLIKALQFNPRPEFPD